MEKIQIGLPVMLHSEPEIKAFLNAKKRIEKYGENIEQPIEVGAFLYYTPRALSEENRSKQIINQERYQLPIVHAQAPIQLENCLAYTSEDEEKFKRKSLLETTIEQTYEVRKHDPQKSNPVHVDMHLGIIVVREGLQEHAHLPCIYSLDEFLDKKDELLTKCIMRYDQLKALAQKRGLGTVIENSITAAFSPDHTLSKTPRMLYFPFNDLNSLNTISKGSITFDTGHWAATRSARYQLENNHAYDDREFLFRMEDITSWKEYLTRNPSCQEYLNFFTKVFHVSNVTGLGVHLEKHPELQKQWGDAGTTDGLISRNEFQSITEYARANGRPLILEVEYDLKNIPQNEFKEADPLITDMLTQEV